MDELVATWCVLLLLLGWVSWVDSRTRRIPNYLIVVGAGTGSILRFIFGGIHGLEGAALGLVVGLIVGLIGERIPVGMGRWGMGDAKTLAVIGVCLGWFGAVATAFVAGILLAVIRIVSLTVRKGKPFRTLAFGPVLAVAVFVLMGSELGALQWIRL